MKYISNLLKFVQSLVTFALVASIFLFAMAYTSKNDTETMLKETLQERMAKERDELYKWQLYLEEAEKKKAQQQQETTVGTGHKIKIVCGSLNVRSGPGKDYSIITSVKKGTELYLVEDEKVKGWAHVYYKEGKDGYVSGGNQYISYIDN